MKAILLNLLKGLLILCSKVFGSRCRASTQIRMKSDNFDLYVQCREEAINDSKPNSILESSRDEEI